MRKFDENVSTILVENDLGNIVQSVDEWNKSLHSAVSQPSITHCTRLLSFRSYNWNLRANGKNMLDKSRNIAQF